MREDRAGYHHGELRRRADRHLKAAPGRRQIVRVRERHPAVPDADGHHGVPLLHRPRDDQLLPRGAHRGTLNGVWLHAPAFVRVSGEGPGRVPPLPHRGVLGELPPAVRRDRVSRSRGGGLPGPERRRGGRRGEGAARVGGALRQLSAALGSFRQHGGGRGRGRPREPAAGDHARPRGGGRGLRLRRAQGGPGDGRVPVERGDDGGVPAVGAHQEARARQAQAARLHREDRGRVRRAQCIPQPDARSRRRAPRGLRDRAHGDLALRYWGGGGGGCAHRGGRARLRAPGDLQQLPRLHGQHPRQEIQRPRGPREPLPGGGAGDAPRGEPGLHRSPPRHPQAGVPLDHHHHRALHRPRAALRRAQ
mmetsp:Transcript_54297/g.172431  ORF Transcript_54297/g.172431 Transcript_54297/m.172431 type:complete len:363 (+) Transcript_54297:380-1468(+)